MLFQHPAQVHEVCGRARQRITKLKRLLFDVSELLGNLATSFHISHLHVGGCKLLLHERLHGSDQRCRKGSTLGSGLAHAGSQLLAVLLGALMRRQCVVQLFLAGTDVVNRSSHALVLHHQHGNALRRQSAHAVLDHLPQLVLLALGALQLSLQRHAHPLDTGERRRHRARKCGPDYNTKSNILHFRNPLSGVLP